MAVAEAPNMDDIAPLDLPNSANLDASGEPIKRRRGRPPGSKNKTYGGQPVGSRGPRRGSLEKEVGALLFMVNMPLSMVPMLQKDALDPIEIQALAKAIDQQCATSPTFRKYVEQALKVQGGTSLVAVVGMIAARRVVRHDVIPESTLEPIGGKDSVDLLIGQAISMTSQLGVFAASQVAQTVAPNITTPPVETS